MKALNPKMQTSVWQQSSWLVPRRTIQQVELRFTANLGSGRTGGPSLPEASQISIRESTQYTKTDV